MHYVSNAVGAFIFLCLSAVVVLHIAPSMEQRLQSDAQTLLDQLDYELTASADGLRVLVSGQVPSIEERYAVFSHLRKLHSWADVRPDVSVIEPSRFEKASQMAQDGVGSSTDPQAASQPEPFINVDVEEGEMLIDIGLDSCANLRALDPSVVCTETN